MKEKNKLFKESLSHVFYENPVLVGGIVIGQLAAGTTTLQSGVALTVAFFFVTMPVLLFAAAFGKFFSRWFRIVLYMLISGVMLLPAYFACRFITPNVFDTVGIDLPLLAVTSIPMVYSERYTEKREIRKAFCDGIGLWLGFGVVAVFLGFFRELFGCGSVWGYRLSSAMFPAVCMPFWGFILLGFMAAAIAVIKNCIDKPKYEYDKKEEEA